MPAIFDEKQALRQQMRTARNAAFAALPPSMRGLVFARPPAIIQPWIDEARVIALYEPMGSEAPTARYATFLAEQGKTLVLPHFASRTAPMTFRHYRWPEPLQPGPFRIAQPVDDADELVPDLAFVPLLAFSADGGRLGQGAGHYDRYLAANPGIRTIGLAWNCQLAEDLPTEPHDQRLDAIITPTRLYQPQQNMPS